MCSQGLAGLPALYVTTAGRRALTHFFKSMHIAQIVGGFWIFVLYPEHDIVAQFLSYIPILTHMRSITAFNSCLSVEP